MYHSQKKKVKIYSTGVCLPTKIVKSVDLLDEIKSENLYGINRNRITETMGSDEARMASDITKLSDLATPAARDALSKLSNIDFQHIDLVVFFGNRRDQSGPATVLTIENPLGLNPRYAYDVANPCYGFIDAMHIATNYIQSGAVRYALVVTWEVPIRVFKAALDIFKTGVYIETSGNIIGALSVGNVGSAAILDAANYENN